jgi:hypothetical protein
MNSGALTTEIQISWPFWWGAPERQPCTILKGDSFCCTPVGYLRRRPPKPPESWVGYVLT